MEDRQELYDELREKNSITRSVRQRPSGKKKYMLPSDALSASERKKMNGEIIMYKMKEPISYAKFSGYPKDVQKEYVQWFIDEFGVSSGMMSSVFGITPNYCTNRMRFLGLAKAFPFRARSGAQEKLNEWLKQFGKEQPVAKEEKPPQKEKAVVTPYFSNITSGELLLEGKASEIGQTIFNIFRDEMVTMQIQFSVIKKAEEKDSE